MYHVFSADSFTTDDIVLLWSSKRAATAVLPDAYIPDFLLINTTAADCTTTYATGQWNKTINWLYDSTDSWQTVSESCMDKL